MNQLRSCPTSKEGGPTSLIDVLAIATAREAIFSHLWHRRALRQTCSAVCAVVDQHVESLHLSVSEQDHVTLAGQLARKGVRPRKLYLHSGGTCHALIALLTEEQQHHRLFQRVGKLRLVSALSSELLQGLSEAMPSLTQLIMLLGASGQDMQLLASAQWPSLRKLDLRGSQMQHCCLLHTMTCLQMLRIEYLDICGVGALAQLTGLTELHLVQSHKCKGVRLIPAAAQSELGSVLAALTGLKSLHIPHAPPGPVTHALSQLTALTQLCLLRQDLVPIVNPGPLTLPSVLTCTFDSIVTVQHLACVEAPCLRHLEADMASQPSDLAELRRLCRGLFTATNSLRFELQNAWSKEDTATLMEVLHQGWQPSAEALQPPNSGLEDSNSSQHLRQWRLDLSGATCSRQCLSLLPIGLNCLFLSSCTLDPDSLDPLAQVVSLKQLRLRWCTGVTIATVERLLDTAVQGCWLKVILWCCQPQMMKEAASQLHSKVLAQRGSRDTPVLSVDHDAMV